MMFGRRKWKGQLWTTKDINRYRLEDEDLSMRWMVIVNLHRSYVLVMWRVLFSNLTTNFIIFSCAKDFGNCVGPGGTQYLGVLGVITDLAPIISPFY